MKMTEMEVLILHKLPRIDNKTIHSFVMYLIGNVHMWVVLIAIDSTVQNTDV